MKKLLLILAVILAPIFVFMFDYFYYPLLNFKAKSTTEQFLEKKYNEDFTVVKSSFSKPLGESGLYNVDAHPTKDAALSVRVRITEDMKVVSDSYVESTWRSQLNEEFGKVYESLFGEKKPYSYAVNLGLASHVYKNYDLSNTYQEIFEKEHHEMSHIVFITLTHDPSQNMNQEVDRLYELLMYLKEKDVNSFSVLVTYYREDIRKDLSEKDKQLNYFEFRDKHLIDAIYHFSFDFTSTDPTSVQRLEKITSPEDVKKYLRQPS